jgi:hypothetical protein
MDTKCGIAQFPSGRSNVHLKRQEQVLVNYNEWICTGFNPQHQREIPSTSSIKLPISMHEDIYLPHVSGNPKYMRLIEHFKIK